MIHIQLMLHGNNVVSFDAESLPENVSDNVISGLAQYKGLFYQLLTNLEGGKYWNGPKTCEQLNKVKG